ALQRSAHFFTAALPRAILPPDFNRHGGTHNTYGWHVDSALRSLPGPAHEVADAGPAWLRADISATLFLSDPADYEGGELQIEDSFGTRAIKGAAGSLVVYPSSSVHRVAPVTRGERLACFMFIQSLVRDPGRRRLLYDMDLALLEMRQQHGDSPATVSLTGCYHNLLRQWAETA
ncbi:MAG: iron-regulated outer membrane protein, partial [Pseudomonadota bacterium]